MEQVACEEVSQSQSVVKDVVVCVAKDAELVQELRALEDLLDACEQLNLNVCHGLCKLGVKATHS